MNKIDEAIARLHKQYGGRRRYVSQHPDYHRQWWRCEVIDGDTRKGYWDWVIEKIVTESQEDAPFEEQIQKELRHYFVPSWRISREDFLALELQKQYSDYDNQAASIRITGVCQRSCRVTSSCLL